MVLCGLRLLLVLQRIQRQRQTRLVSIRSILSQRVLADGLIHLGKSRRSQLLRAGRIPGCERCAHPTDRRTHPRAIHAIDSLPVLRLPNILQYRFRLLLMFYRPALCHSLLLSSFISIIESIRPSLLCQFIQANFGVSPLLWGSVYRESGEVWPVDSLTGRVSRFDTPRR
jgi:hypothetical protein